MNYPFYKTLIVGAGLSGLTTAYKLHKAGERNFVVLESRDRIGGRILTSGGIDLGATWFHNHHQQVIELLDELGINKFHQYNQGRNVLVYSTMAPEHYFYSDQNTPSAFRIAGGSKSLIQTLAKEFTENIKTETRVNALSEKGNEIHVETNKGIFRAEKVIISLPPRLAAQFSFSPAPPDSLLTTLKKTHTWMSNAMKVGLTFKLPFWRDKDLSGTIIGQVGPVIELYDHTDIHDKKYALMGFINEAMRMVSAEERKTKILDYLKKYFGEEVMNYLEYMEKDWGQDHDTSCELTRSIYMSPSYGDPLFDQAYFNGKLLFSGAETATQHGGYMDGAILSGIHAAHKVSQKLKAKG